MGSVTKPQRSTHFFTSKVPHTFNMVLALKHVVVLSVVLTFMFFGILGTCCQDGACGGNPEAFEYIGYFGWGFGLMATCVGIITSQGGSTDLNKVEEEREQANANKA